ncbi:MAG: hypothetical protein ACXAEX_11525 [Promethearchaeota archaeon]|jgi:hypothetical protein
MTQIIKKETVIEFPNLTDLKESHQNNRREVLNCFFREFSFVSRTQKIRTLTPQEYILIASKTKLPVKEIQPIVRNFLVWLVYFRRFLKSYQFSYIYTRQLRKLRIYLHKIYRIVPIFDLERAVENARLLKKKLRSICFVPQFLTQLAIIIYVTDLNDTHFEKRIKQVNLRVLCNCSAYAFHRTRNKIGLK